MIIYNKTIIIILLYYIIIILLLYYYYYIIYCVHVFPFGDVHPAFRSPIPAVRGCQLVCTLNASRGMCSPPNVGRLS